MCRRGIGAELTARSRFDRNTQVQGDRRFDEGRKEGGEGWTMV